MKRHAVATLVAAITLGCFSTAVAEGPPFSFQDVPKDGASIAIDGQIGAGEWNGTKLEFSWTHGQTRDGDDQADVIPCDESDVCNGEPLSVSIQYAWDDSNFYYLVEETTIDDDPTVGITAGDWCHQCTNADAADTDAAPWSTDSVGFYTTGIKWTPGSEDGEFYTAFEMGPLIQPWVGLIAEEDLVIDGETQYRHLTRAVTPGFGESGAQLIGPEHEPHDSFIEDLEDRWDLSQPQSAFGVTEDGRRVAEMFMRWDQLLYDVNDPDEIVQERLEILEAENPGILELLSTASVKEGFEFRMDPLLVDGTDDFSFGGQTHPEGNLHPNTSLTDEFFEISVVRLTAASVGQSPGDFNGDGNVNVADLDVMVLGDAAFDVTGDGVADASDLNTMLSDLIGTWTGDSNGDGQFNTSDLVAVFSSGKYETGETANWSEGDWDLDGQFGSGDLVAAFSEGGYEVGPRVAVAAVPEPATGLLTLCVLPLLGCLRRRK